MQSASGRARHTGVCARPMAREVWRRSRYSPRRSSPRLLPNRVRMSSRRARPPWSSAASCSSAATVSSSLPPSSSTSEATPIRWPTYGTGRALLRLLGVHLMSVVKGVVEPRRKLDHWGLLSRYCAPEPIVAHIFHIHPPMAGWVRRNRGLRKRVQGVSAAWSC